MENAETFLSAAEHYMNDVTIGSEHQLAKSMEFLYLITYSYHATCTTLIPCASLEALTTYLNIKIHQLILPQNVIYLSCLQPSICLLLFFLEIYKYSKASFGVFQSWPVGPETGKSANHRGVLLNCKWFSSQWEKPYVNIRDILFPLFNAQV